GGVSPISAPPENPGLKLTTPACPGARTHLVPPPGKARPIGFFDHIAANFELFIRISRTYLRPIQQWDFEI
ncbi:hypothetical protein, partial [Afifella marina]